MKKRTVTHATFTLQRNFKKPPAKVFHAFSDMAAKEAWFHGPEEWGRDRHTMDFRVGGTEVSIGGPPGGPVSSFRALYQDIVPDQRIIYSYDMDLDGERISVSVATIEFVPDGSGTRLTLTEMGAYLDGWDKPGDREHGTRELLGNLARYVDGD
jgi:uncharacterized protein YndB with AHSA1/START domain